ncbi:4Fe-4S binding protein [Candidatus Woesearchaeota archaeon]|nr:4Fe-4S binding protein [Candidatus Woesearchaeota archaeon]MBW3018102.1 4Fe-4S binding protein [Candidatus Woesearchaeota archaeon]
MKKVGPLEWNEKLCKFCNLCIQMCPKNGLKFEGKELVQTAECIKCGICCKYCPEMGLNLEKSENRKEIKSKK